jgi:Tol biopolymer transport system component
MMAIGAIAIAITAALAPSAAVAAFPGSNGRIAYAGVAYGPLGDPDRPDDEIFTILPDGSGRQQLTDNDVHDADPSWSADGGSLVFSRALSGATSDRQVFKMSADGSQQTQVTHGSANGIAPSFAPSGRRIVYVKYHRGPDRPRRTSISTIGADGTDPRRLVASGLRRGVTSPQYSPDGRRVVFAGRPKGKRRDAIWSIRRDGSRLRRLSDPAKNFDDMQPGYSPDGRRIAFVRCDIDFIHGCGLGGVYLMRADGSGERRIPGTEDSTPISPAYAPAGDRIALTGQGIPLPFNTLFTINPAGQDRRNVFSCGPCAVSAPSWQPLPNSG